MLTCEIDRARRLVLMRGTALPSFEEWRDRLDGFLADERCRRGFSFIDDCTLTHDIPTAGLERCIAYGSPRDGNEARVNLPATEREVVAHMRRYYEAQFPLDCPNCKRRFSSLTEYVATCPPVGMYTSYDLESDAGAQECLGTLALARCPCGDTLGLGSDGIPAAEQRALLRWARDEAARRQMSPEAYLDALRQQLRSELLRERSPSSSRSPDSGRS